MPKYRPPVDDMCFVINDLLGFAHEEFDTDTIGAVLEEAAKLSADVLAPLNQTGDQNGAKLDGRDVTTAPGFKEAYRQYCEGGWNAVPFDPDYGGQGLPYVVAFVIQEMWQGANMSFGLCPLLNQGAVEAISHHGSQEQKDYYLAKLISGEWTGTMNLTEPQAGSDLGLLRAKAEPDGGPPSPEGSGAASAYKISGQKIFITYGEHDMAENIIHLVLARLPDAPEDVKGISLFIVPKFLEDGTRNSVNCIGIEHKLGIHASPTCTMEFDGATGYLIGEEHQGLKYMFTMMNNARLSVGLQGVAIAEASYQAAQQYATDRIQGKSFTTGERVAIAEHADVKRMLLSMKSQIEAGRALTYEAALAMDQGDREKVDLLTPIVKSWCTDMSCDVTSTAIQIHGGMGFIEETGAAQFYRDARILPIYEGTNSIQAADLVFRKIIRDGGAAADKYIQQMESTLPAPYQEAFITNLSILHNAKEVVLSLGADKKLDGVSALAVPFLNGFGLIAGGVLLARAAGLDDSKSEIADFFIRHHLPHAEAYLKTVTA